MITAHAHNTDDRLLNLAWSYELLQRGLNAIAEPVMVKDRRHRWVAGNDAMAAIIGRPLEEVIGRSDAGRSDDANDNALPGFGISPQIAQTLVGLGIDFSHITTRATLQQGLAAALER